MDILDFQENNYINRVYGNEEQANEKCSSPLMYQFDFLQIPPRYAKKKKIHKVREPAVEFLLTILSSKSSSESGSRKSSSPGDSGVGIETSKRDDAIRRQNEGQCRRPAESLRKFDFFPWQGGERAKAADTRKYQDESRGR